MDHRAPSVPETDDHLREVEGALHDVANTLTVVLGWLEVAAEKTGDGVDGGSSALAVAMAWARQGRAIALEAIGASTSQTDSSVSCSELAMRASSGVAPRARAGNAAVRVSLDAKLETSPVAAPVRALQVLTNLLLNALSFTPPGTDVLLEVSAADEGRIRFVVRDSGPGFSRAQVERGLQGLESTRQGGTGIGLRHSHLLAESIGGSLRILRAGPGAEVELLWPVAVRRATSGLKRSSSGGLDGKRILVVEDDEAVWMLLETALEVRGARVRLASDERQLEGLLATEAFDAALVDLSPIEARAVELLDRIKCTGGEVRVVLISGAARSPDARVLSRAAAWVRKPFEIAEIVDALTAPPSR